MSSTQTIDCRAFIPLHGKSVQTNIRHIQWRMWRQTEYLSEFFVQPGVKSLLFTVPTELVFLGCVRENKREMDIGQPVAATKGSTNAVNFLTDIPSLKSVSLGMTKDEFLTMVRQEKLNYTQETANGQTTYWVRPKERVVVIFGFEGKCTGIQRMRD